MYLILLKAYQKLLARIAKNVCELPVLIRHFDKKKKNTSVCILS